MIDATEILATAAAVFGLASLVYTVLKSLSRATHSSKIVISTKGKTVTITNARRVDTSAIIKALQDFDAPKKVTLGDTGKESGDKSD